jgi:uncharacterized protein
MASFASPSLYGELAGMQLWANPWDRAVEKWIQAGAEGKFYPMFSFLFGVGTVIFWQRAAQKGFRPVPLYARRLAALFLFGLIHALFIWSGDILATYALLGFVLLLYCGKPLRSLRRWGIGLLAGQVLLIALINVLAMIGSVYEGASGSGEASYYRTLVEQSYKVYHEGSFVDVTRQRIEELLFALPYAIFAYPVILAMFLFGAYAGKKGIFADIPGNLPLIKRVWIISGLIGGAATVLGVIGESGMKAETVTLYDLCFSVGHTVSGPALCFFYTASVLIVSQRPGWKQRLKPIAAVGRLGITNYLLQSLICTTLFYGYGFGFYGKVGPAGGLLLTIAIYLLQLLFSLYWLRRFRYGPVEWLWRKLTYGTL